MLLGTKYVLIRRGGTWPGSAVFLSLTKPFISPTTLTIAPNRTVRYAAVGRPSRANNQLTCVTRIDPATSLRFDPARLREYRRSLSKR